jgi:hypothetical protein
MHLKYPMDYVKRTKWYNILLFATTLCLQYSGAAHAVKKLTSITKIQMENEIGKCIQTLNETTNSVSLINNLTHILPFTYFFIFFFLFLIIFIYVFTEVS